MSRILIILGLLVFVALGVAGGTWQWFNTYYQANGPLVVPATVVIHKGARTIEIALLLKQAGVISNPKLFVWGLRLLAGPKPLRAGEYNFKPRMSPAQVISHLQTGKTVVRKVTIAEGLNNLEVAKLLANTPGLSGPAGTFANGGSTVTGNLPFLLRPQPEGLVKRMRQAMTHLLSEAWPHRASGLPLQNTS